MKHQVEVFFGDCDPAGIVWYPHMAGWLDQTFHVALRPLGGHAALCEQLGVRGLGVVDMGLTFRAPVFDGDLIEIEVSVEKWSGRTFELRYTAVRNGGIVFEGRETRAAFVAGPDGRLSAGDLAPLKSLWNDEQE